MDSPVTLQAGAVSATEGDLTLSGAVTLGGSTAHVDTAHFSDSLALIGGVKGIGTLSVSGFGADHVGGDIAAGAVLTYWGTSTSTLTIDGVN